MAVQTTGAMSAYDLYVGVSAAGATYTNVSGSAVSVEVSGGERATGSVNTFYGDTPILTAGKRGPITVTIRGVYSADADELYALAKTQYELAGGTLYARWSPMGGDSGDIGYTTSKGIVKSCVYAGGDATSGDPVMVEVVIECASVTAATIGTAGWEA